MDQALPQDCAVAGKFGRKSGCKGKDAHDATMLRNKVSPEFATLTRD